MKFQQKVETVLWALMKINIKVFMQRNFTLSFFLPQCRDIIKWVDNFFYKSSLSGFFHEKFSFE